MSKQNLEIIHTVDTNHKNGYNRDLYSKESDIYRKDKICIKSYHISREFVSVYNSFQKKVSQIMWTFRFNTPSILIPRKCLPSLKCSFGEMKVEKVKIQILETPWKVLSQSTVCSTLKWVIAELPFIEGDTILDFFWDLSDESMVLLSSSIVNHINSILASKFDLNMSIGLRWDNAAGQISGMNLKISEVDEGKWEISFILIDIASNIRILIDKNEREIQEIINPQFCYV